MGSVLQRVAVMDILPLLHCASDRKAFTESCGLLYRGRLGYFHVVNNYYSGWAIYAIGGSANPTINSEGNYFDASGSPSEVRSFLPFEPFTWIKVCNAFCCLLLYFVKLTVKLGLSGR